MKKDLLLVCTAFLTVLLLGSCSATMNLRFPITVNPELVLPDHIQKVGVLNRSLPTSDNGGKVVNVVEGVISGEGVFEDRNGSRAAVAGAHTRLNNDGLVEAVLMDTLVTSSATGGAMPMPLSWAEVQRLCEQYQVQGLLVLEAFDTDQAGSMTTNTVGQIINTAQGGTIRPPAPPTNTRVLVKLGWRLYDYQTKMVLDEVRMSDYFGVRQGGVLPDLGEFAKRDAIQQSAYMGGHAYGARMMPGRVMLYREFYRRKGPEMKQATRLVQINEWDEAMAIWEPLSRTAKRKTAGRACYNMAIACEVRGEIDKAIDWAKRAYGEFGDRRARDYVRVLQRR